MLRCCVVLGKTQHEVENEYYFVDLPELLLLKDQQHAAEIIELIDVEVFPHIAEKRDRDEVLRRYTRVLPKATAPKPKSAEEQYQAHLARMRGGR